MPCLHGLKGCMFFLWIFPGQVCFPRTSVDQAAFQCDTQAEISSGETSALD
uniref:Uncharacterized protein n=1 Tax=Anguilla anguilla TaxID=7936 RepID=A0A0E9RT41_ANGAN